MKTYQFPTPRSMFGIAALGMTVITFGLLVGAPAAIDGSRGDAHAAAKVKRVAPMPTEVVINPSVIEIVAVRDARPVAADTGGLPARRAQQG